MILNAIFEKYNTLFGITIPMFILGNIQMGIISATIICKILMYKIWSIHDDVVT